MSSNPRVRPLHELIPPASTPEALAQLDLEMLMAAGDPAAAIANSVTASPTQATPVWQEDLTNQIYEKLLASNPPDPTLTYEARLMHMAKLMEEAREHARSSGLPSRGATQVAAAVLAARAAPREDQTTD